MKSFNVCDYIWFSLRNAKFVSNLWKSNHQSVLMISEVLKYGVFCFLPDIETVHSISHQMSQTKKGMIRWVLWHKFSEENAGQDGSHAAH